MNSSLESVLKLLKDAEDDDYIGEPVSQLQHALQAAYFTRQDSPENASLIAAALLHDIGHLLRDADLQYMSNLGVLNHEDKGASFLQSLGFCEEVCELVRSHVAAKRYLVSKFETYRNNLSKASQETLSYQGGLMSAEEMVKFESRPHFRIYLKIRHFDDAAKKKDFPVPDLDAYIPVLEKVCDDKRCVLEKT